MKKYRIIKVEKLDETYYLLAIKKWFFFWLIECDSYCDDLGISYYERKFETKEEAREFFIKWYVEPKMTIVE
jgi:hypothetical protein